MMWPHRPLLAGTGLSSAVTSLVFITDSFDGPFSLPGAPAPARAADHPGGCAAGHVQHGSPRNF